MPIQEFRCQDCNALFEELVSDAQSVDAVVCKKCGGGRVKKTISAASFKIAGSGGAIPQGALSGCSTKSGFS